MNDTLFFGGPDSTESFDSVPIIIEGEEFTLFDFDDDSLDESPDQ